MACMDMVYKWIILNIGDAHTHTHTHTHTRGHHTKRVAEEAGCRWRVSRDKILTALENNHIAIELGPEL